MPLTLAVLEGTGWRAESVLAATRRAAGILAQCAIGVSEIALHEFSGPARYRAFDTPVSREFAKAAALRTPAVYFVAETLQQPAFDAEAIGRGNSRTRPEMRDTVWIFSGARDLPVIIAHELAHVLANSGDHSDDAGNLMAERTSMASTRLTPAQCQGITREATTNGLLRPLN